MQSGRTLFVLFHHSNTLIWCNFASLYYHVCTASAWNNHFVFRISDSSGLTPGMGMTPGEKESTCDTALFLDYYLIIYNFSFVLLIVKHSLICSGMTPTMTPGAMTPGMTDPTTPSGGLNMHVNAIMGGIEAQVLVNIISKFFSSLFLSSW